MDENGLLLDDDLFYIEETEGGSDPCTTTD